MLKRIIDFFRGGTREFNDAEKQILSFVLSVLPKNEKDVLSEQVASVSIVQRTHPGRLVVAYYRKQDKVPQLPYSGYEYCLANVSYKSRGKTKTTGLVLHDGRFMSFERNVPETIADIESLLKVTLHPKGVSSVADEINAEEHRNNG